jgi:hypothetical protein
VDRKTGEERAELLAPKLSIAETSVQRACTLLPGFRARRYRATGRSASNGAPPDKGEASGKAHAAEFAAKTLDAVAKAANWVAVLSRRINASLAASTGVEHSEEVIKYLLAGADVVMTTSALLRFGISHMRRLLEGLTQWLHARGIETLDGFRGALSEARLQHSEGFERANYLKILQAFPTSQEHGTRR